MTRKTYPNGRTIKRIFNAIDKLPEKKIVGLNELRSSITPLVYYSSFKQAINFLEEVGTIKKLKIANRTFIQKKINGAPTTDKEKEPHE